MAFCLKAVLLCPADVHAQQHVRPVLAFGTSSTGIDLDIGVVAIRLAGKQGLKLLLGCIGLECGQRRLRFPDHGRVAFGLTEFDEFGVVAEATLDFLDGPNARFQTAGGRA